MKYDRIQNQRGSMVIEVALGVIALLAVGFGVYEAHKNHTTKTAATTTTHNQAVAATPATIDDTAAATFAKQFYVQYAGAAAGTADGPPDEAGMKQAVTSDGTAIFQSFYNQGRDYDPVFCGQNTPSAADISVVSHAAKDATSATVVMGENAAGTGEQANPSVTVVKSGSSFKIDAISCPNL